MGGCTRAGTRDNAAGTVQGEGRGRVNDEIYVAQGLHSVVAVTNRSARGSAPHTVYAWRLPHYRNVYHVCVCELALARNNNILLVGVVVAVPNRKG